MNRKIDKNGKVSINIYCILQSLMTLKLLIFLTEGSSFLSLGPIIFSHKKNYFFQIKNRSEWSFKIDISN